jgi:ATP-dependent helicase YprA (DUF1998 family)
LFKSYRELVHAALEVVRHCPCENGCPGCVGPCEEVGMLGKETALCILAHLDAGAPARSVPIDEPAEIRS